MNLKVQLMFDFAALHLRTCGAEAVALAEENDVVIQRCVCGAEQTPDFSDEEADEFLRIWEDEDAFNAHADAAARRTTQ